MYRTTIDYHKRSFNNKEPIAYITINTNLGFRAYGEKELSLVADIAGTFADGSYTADGSRTAGAGVGFIEKSGRLLSMSGFNRSSQKANKGLLLGYSKKVQQNMVITLNNADRHLSKLIVKEPFISKNLVVYLGFEALSFSEDISIFQGTISSVSISGENMILEAKE